MADRPNMPGYPMPNGFPMNMGQPQQQQQPMMQQQLQPNPNPMQTPTNLNEQRMWQLQRMQIENQRRAQMGVVDGMGSQITPQMAGLLRNQAALMQNQGQHGPMQPQQMQPAQGQQFSNIGQLGQMNSMNIGQANQPHQGLGQLQQSPSHPGMPGVNQGMSPAMVARVNPAMLSSYLQNGRLNRQMNLLNTARNQQPQNGPVAFNPQNTPFNNQFGQGPLQPDLRAPNQGQPQTMPGKPTDAQLQMMQQQRQVTQFIQEFLRGKDGRQLTNEEIRMKTLHFKRDIDADRLLAQQLQAQQLQSTTPNPEIALGLKMKQEAIKQKEFLFARLQSIVQGRSGHNPLQVMAEGQGGGPSNVHLQPNVGAQQPNTGWVAQDRAIGNQPGPISTPNLTNVQPTGNVLPPHPQMSNSPFHPSLTHPQQTTPVPRMGPTPQQHPMENFLRQQNNQPSPQRGPTPATTPQNRPQPHFDHPEGPRPGPVMGSMPTLDRLKFEDMIKQWWQHNGTSVDERMLLLGERRIDLYELYVEVTRLGGAVAVNRHDLWPVIAGKLGWAGTPAQGSEPARSAPQAANQMKVVYEHYVSAFEQQISAYNLREVMSGLSSNNNQQSAENPSGPSAPPPLLQLVRFAPMPAEMLRKNGVPEAMIQQVEQNRPTLQAMYKQVQRMQGTSANVNGPNMPTHPQIQPMHSNVPQSTVGAQNQTTNQPFIASGPGSVPNGQNGFGSIQHPPSNGQINQQRWAEAAATIMRLKEELSRERNNQPMLPKNVHEDEKTQINQFFEAFVRLATDIDKILPMYFYLHNDLNFVKNLVSIVDIVARQRRLLQSQPPMYILDLNSLKRLYFISTQARERFQELLLRHKQMGLGRVANNGQGPPSDGGLPMPGGIQQGVHSIGQGQIPGAISSVPRPPSRQPQLPANLHPAVSRPVMMPPARPPSVSQGKAKATGVADNAQSPAAPVSTPGPSASTPNTLASPQTPKSPKAPKAPAKPKPQKQRRASKAAPPTPTVAPAPAPSQSSSSAENPLKRSREEESAPSAKPETGHAAKRIKGEWEETPNLEPSKMRKESQDFNTPEKATQFYKDMTQLMEILNNPGDSNGHGLNHDFVEALATVAASCMPQEATDPLLGSSEIKESSSPKLGTSGVDALFNEFLDFTSFNQDDEKVETPDLVPSSSTNPSPESNAEPDTHPPAVTDVAKAVDIKTEPFADFPDDPTRLGIWGELDGGESSYFTSDFSWKWDGASSTENSWAIST